MKQISFVLLYLKSHMGLPPDKLKIVLGRNKNLRIEIYILGLKIEFDA